MNILNSIIHNRQKVRGTQYSSTDECKQNMVYSVNERLPLSACNVGAWVPSLGWKDPLEKGKATLKNSMDYV